MVRFYGISPFMCQVSAVIINFTFNFFIAQLLVFRGELLPLEHFVEKSFGDLARVERETQKNVVFVVPIFKEHHRLFPQTPDNPMGEDSLKLKIEQLESLFGGRPDFRWKLVFTDDGDLEYQSGRRLQAHLKARYAAYVEEGRIEVRFLEELKPEWVRDSQKGGAVIATIRSVELRADDIIFYTDADKSNDLRLAGTLIGEIACNNTPIAISSRWLQESTVVNRGVKAKLSSFIYNVLVFLFLGISYTDTQNGLKAFRFDAAKRIVEHCRDIRFSFDTEILMIASVLGYPVVEVPTFFEDSVEESTVDLKRDALRMVAALNAQRRLKRRLKKALRRKALQCRDIPLKDCEKERNPM
jgi:hypothetical protein